MQSEADKKIFFFFIFLQIIYFSNYDINKLIKVQDSLYKIKSLKNE